MELQKLFESITSLLVEAARLPESPERGAQTQAGLCLPKFLRPAENGAEIVLIGFELVEPFSCRPSPEELLLVSLDELGEEVGHTAARRRVRRLDPRVVRDRLVDRKPVADALDQPSLHQRRDHGRRRIRNRRRCGLREGARLRGKRGKRSERSLTRLVQRIVAHADDRQQ